MTAMDKLSDARGIVTVTDLRGMAVKSMEMLAAVPDRSVKARAKRAAKRFLKRSSASEKDPIFWPAGFLMLGLAGYAEAFPDDEAAAGCLDAVRERLEEWKKDGGKVRYADDSLAGCAMLMCHRLTGESCYMDMADGICEYLVDEAPKDAEGALIYHPSPVNSCIYADGTGMSALFLSGYAAAGGKDGDKALELAGRELASFMKHGTDEQTGLPYHGYLLTDGGSQEKKGLVGWGRAVGFLLMGMSSYCGITDDPEIKEYYETMTAAALKRQRADGCFPWLLTAADGHVDTAATAMIGWALANTGNGQHERETMSIAAGLKRYLKDGAMTEALAECVDFGEHPQRYGCYPWGQGASLAFFSRL